MTQDSISHYRILGKLGEGGMGVVYRALDTRLERTVALKLLPREAMGDPERRWRFEREAKAASALNHPNIVTIYDIDRAALGDGEPVDFIAMECVEGETLDRILAARRLSLDEALDFATQMAGALAAAHEAGIVHRDIKPGNVIVARSGQVKVLDFGLAKLLDPATAAAPSSTDSLAATITAATAAPGTHQGAVLGTLAYMSPEQAQGKPVDARSDVFSFGSVLYEMLSGKRPFQQDSNLLTLAAILRDPVAPLKSVRPDVPGEVERIVTRALEKEPQDRYGSAMEMREALAACRSRSAAGPAAVSFLRRRAVLVPAAAAVVAILALAGWLLWRASRARWAREVALPEAVRLTRNNEPFAGYLLAREAARWAPADARRMRGEFWYGPGFPIESVPPGADIFVKDYLTPGAPWSRIGTSPMKDVSLPLGYYRWRVTKTGFEPVETASNRPWPFHLDPSGTIPSGMVHVPAGSVQVRILPAVELPDYFLDKYEVTNAQFKQFVDQGGYAKAELWKQPFVRDGAAVSREEAIHGFRDATGRPGPATWSLGTYPEGQADYPVGGISWYEAAAYAEFAGKSLPTIYHWYNAAGTVGPSGSFSGILRLSNFSGKGPERVGTRQGLSPSGSYDMAGNVREWCWNETAGKRYILGGSWNDPEYFFAEGEAQSPFDRSPTNGFRCMKTSGPPAEALLSPIPVLARDFSKETPVPDEVFNVFRGFYSYDRTPLDAKTEAMDESSPYWRKETVSFRAAYGNERVPAYLFLPRNAAPPYQTVVFFPGSGAQMNRSSENLQYRLFEFVVRSGRALVYPIYKEMFERLTPETARGPSFKRDLVIDWHKDLGRTLDYLETRQDFDRTRIAYYGFSLGANDGVVLVALEPRFRTAVLAAGGFRFGRFPPEIDMINFAPRITIPVLYLGGSQDFSHPVETAQKPLFRMLGTPEKDKRHFLFEGGHIPMKMEGVIKEILDWLDRYLGPVKTTG